MTRRLGIVTALAFAGTALGAGVAPGAGTGVAAGAPAQSTPPACRFDYCAGEEVPPGASPGTPAPSRPDGPGPSRPGGAPPGPVCVWVHWQDATENWFPLIPDPPSGEAELYLEECDGVGTGRARWVEPGEALPAAVLSPAQLAETVRVRLEGNLPTPTVASSPEPGVAALVGVPAFVAVDNWTPSITDRECDPNYGLCVEVTALPVLEWAPGEPGAPTVACSGAGTRFDPGGAAPDVQAAAPGACAYAYRTRTGVGGRPAAWPGEVAVRWELTWSSTAGGEGSLPDVTKTAAFPRAVDEVQTVVESAG